MANKLVLLNYFFNDKQSLHTGPKIGSRYVGQELGLLTISVGTKAFPLQFLRQKNNPLLDHLNH